MATSIIDGTIEQVEAGRRHPKVSRFKTIVFRERGGATRTFKNAIVSGAVVPEIRVGNDARFYTFTALDLKGIHGVRKPDGTAVYGYPGSNNTIIFAILVAVNLAWIAFRIAFDGQVPFLAVILTLVGAIFWFTASKAGRDTRTQFDADTL